MASVDYGAILRKNGIFVNKDKGLFMNMKEAVGYSLEKIERGNEDTIQIEGDFFVYAGDWG